MSTILHLQSSSNLHSSYSRQIGALLEQNLVEKHPNSRVIVRDLVKNPLPHVTPEMLSAYFGGKSDVPVLAQSNALVEELVSSDVLIVEAPMYNFGIPSALKAWIDHIVRAGLTFQFGANGPEGLVKGKKAILVISRGGVYSAGPMAVMDHQESYLCAVFGFIGIKDIETIYIEGTNSGNAAQAESALQTAKQRVVEVAKSCFA